LDYHQSIAHLKKAAQSLDFLKKFKVLYKIWKLTKYNCVKKRWKADKDEFDLKEMSHITQLFWPDIKANVSVKTVL
jgi:Flp pilus assembly CpaE family ATPase